MKILYTSLKFIIVEVIIIFGLIFSINNYIGNVEQTINADGVGYYDYLPSLAIHHDLVRKNNPFKDTPDLYYRIDSTSVYVDYKDFKVNKYPCGTALLQLPFFTFAYLTSDLESTIHDGYQKPFQKAIFYAAIFYLFLSLLFLKKILSLYDVKPYIIAFSQLILVLATSVTHYVNVEAGFSHIYSLFAVTAFIYFVKSYFNQNKTIHSVLAFACLGLVFILRQPNILIVLFIPFLAGSQENLIASFKTLFINFKSLILGILLFLGITSIQLVLWYLQTGDFFVYSYQGEGFDFLDPYFFSILFSYKKGLFIYTPVLLISMLSLIWLIYKKSYYLFFTWIAFFTTLTFVLSSWWSWYYGCSYGLRAYIDYYVIFLIPFAIMLDRIKKIPRLVIIILSLFTIPLNIIQCYQYKEYILHWIDMDEEKYWKVFLKTEDRFGGLLWKSQLDSNLYSVVKEINAGDFSSTENSTAQLFSGKSSEIEPFDKVSMIQVLFENDFDENNLSYLNLAVTRVNDNFIFFEQNRNLIHFHQGNLNEWHEGYYIFEFDPITDNQEVAITLKVISADKKDYLKNVRLKFYSKP